MVSILVKTPDYSPWFSGIHEGVKWTHAVVAEGNALLHLLHGRSVLLRGGLDSGHGRGGVSPATGIRIRLTNLEQERNEKTHSDKHGFSAYRKAIWSCFFIWKFWNRAHLA